MSGWEQGRESDLMDDDGIYYQNVAMPQEIKRGAAPQRLDMRHGFMRHIVSNMFCLQAAFSAHIQQSEYHRDGLAGTKPEC